MSSVVFDRPGLHRLGNDAVGSDGARSSRSSAGTCTADRERMSARGKLIDVVRWWSASAAVALALAGCGGGAAGEAGGAAAGSTAPPPQLDQVGALTLAQQSANARTAMRLGPLALAAVSAGTASEDFESGMADWSNWDNAQVVAGVGTSGSQALQVGTGAGGAGLTVPGIVEGTAYRLTAQVKVSDPSDPVYIGINMLSSSGNQVIGHSSPAVSSTGYVTVTVDLVAPANAANAVVWIWKNAGSGYAWLDDVSFGPPTSAPPPPPAPPGSNLVSNGGFESGMNDWVDWGNTSVVSGQANSGTSALSVGTAAGGAGQTVGGITAGAIYRLVAHAKVSDPSETVFVGVNLLNQAGMAVAQMAMPVSSTSYETVSFDITAPSDAASAVVYVWKNAGSGSGYVDDFVFGVAPESAPPPPPPPPPSSANLVMNGGFESGLASWVNWGNTIASTGQAAAGSYAAQVGTDAGGFGQIVAGVVVGSAYRARAQVKVSSPDELGYFGLKFTDDAGNVLGQNYVTFNSTTYATAQVDLAAPANATRALVYVWKNVGSGFAYVDEVSLVRVTPASAPPAPVPVSAIPATDHDSLHYAQLADGGQVVVWNAAPATRNDPFLVHAQLLDANGQKMGAPIAVFGTTGGFSSHGVVGLPDGSFLASASKQVYVAASNTIQTRLYVQKVSSTGQLLPTGGVSDPEVNGGLASRLLTADREDTISFWGGPFFPNPDGSYALAVRSDSRHTPTQFYDTSLVSVDAAGNVIGAPVELGEQNYSRVAIARLSGGVFLFAATPIVAGPSGFILGPASWKVVTNTGQVIAQQTFANGTSTPRVTALADGTGLLVWYDGASGSWTAERIDASGNVLGSAAVPNKLNEVTGLAGGGYVATWGSGSQLVGQYFTATGQPAGASFVLADNLVPGSSTAYSLGPWYRTAQTADGFAAVYQASTSSGPQIFVVRFTAPSLK